MKKYILSFSALVFALIFSGVAMNTVSAQDKAPSSSALSNLTYPITELGSCKDQAACKVYCDNPANTTSCISFAEKKNLLSQEELQTAKKFIASGSIGPGSCKGKNECRTYCENKTHINECIAYAESNGLMSTQELQKAKKIQSAITKGVKFPSCQNKKECDAYCEDSSHMEECINFAKEAGLLSEKELENTQKVLTAVKQGVKVPPCKGKDACDTYCAEAGHADECVNFAIAAGIVTSEEARIIKETGGVGPGGCKNKNECNTYCSSADNREACMSFAKEHNIPQPGQPNQSGTGPGEGADQGKGGPGAGMGPGSGAGQGGGTPSGGLQKPANPMKCISECEIVRDKCIFGLDTATKKCASDGQYCSQVTCENLYTDAEGNRPTQAQSHACSAACLAVENSCYAPIMAEESRCTTTKDECVTSCQKASKPTKPTQPTQPAGTNQPTKPTPPSQPKQPTQPGQSGQNQPFSQVGPGGCSTVSECTSYCQAHPEARIECQAFKQSQKLMQAGQSGQQPNQPSMPTPPQPPSQPPMTN